MSETASNVYRFLDLLGRWDYDVPLTTQWSVCISPEMGDTNIEGFFKKIGEYTEIDATDFKIHPHMMRRVMSNVTQPVVDGIGLYYAQSVTVPKESFAVESAGITGMGGFLKGSVGSDRMDSSTRIMSLELLETNLDFCDALMRPWIIACSYMGMINLGRENSLKADIYIEQYTRNNGDVMKPTRKRHKFSGCMPFDVSENQIKHDEETINTKTVSFIYNSYTYKVFSSD
jgi:hypothetical protein